jgi:hypothetical protein
VGTEIDRNAQGSYDDIIRSMQQYLVQDPLVKFCQWAGIEVSPQLELKFPEGEKPPEFDFSTKSQNKEAPREC